MIDRLSQHGSSANPGAHPASYSMGTGVKCPERDVDRPPPPSAVVKNEWNYTFTPPYTFVEYRHITSPFPKYFGARIAQSV